MTPFPLPSPKPDYGVAAQKVQAISDILGYVISTMAQGVDSQISAVQQNLDAATRALMGSAGARKRAIAKQQAQVISPLVQAAAVGAAESVIQQRQAAAAVQSGAVTNAALTNPVTADSPGDQTMHWYAVQGYGTPCQPVYWSENTANANRSLPSVQFVLGPFDTEAEAATSCLLPVPPTTTPPPVTTPPPIDTTPPPADTTPPVDTQPPVTTPPVTTPPLTPIQIQSSTCVGDFCTRMTALRDSLVILGDSLLNLQSSGDIEPYMSVDWFHALFAAFADYSSTVQDAVKQAQYVIDQVKSFNVIRSYVDRLIVCGITGTWQIARLLAVRGVLVHIGSIDFGMSFAGSKGTNIGANIGLSAGFSGGLGGELVQTKGPVSQSAVLGLHGGSNVGIAGGTGVTSSVNVSTNLFVVPLIEVIDVLIRWSGAWLPLGPDAATQCYLAGEMAESDLQCRVEMAGMNYEEYKTYVHTQFTRPSYVQAEMLYRAGKITGMDRDRYYSLAGVRDQLDKENLIASYQRYPGMNDVISFMVRDVFDPSVVRDNQLDAEFSAKYTEQAEILGEVAGLDKDIARLYWMAHWQYPSVQSLYTMMHRLRPGVVDDKLVVTQADVSKQLGIADFAPAWRDKLVAISYNSISIRQARQFFQNYIIDEAGVEAIYLDQGYYPQQAKQAAQNEVIVKARTRAQLSHGWTVAAMSPAYAVGAITADEVNDRMREQGFDLAEAEQMMRRATIERSARIQLRAQSKAISTAWTAILNAYKVGSIDAANAVNLLSRHGWSAESIQIALAAEDVQSRQAVVAQALTVLRRAFLSGEIGASDVASQLELIGVAQPRIQEYLATWQLQLTPRRKILSGQQTLRLFGEGLLSEDDSRLRLTRLGWADPDLSLLILEARRKREQAEARMLKLSEQSRVKAAAALAKEVKQQQALTQATQSKLCHMVPVSRLIRWYAEHWIEQPYIQERLTTCGYTPDIIAGYLRDATEARRKADEKAAKQIDKLKSASGTGAANGQQSQ